MAYKAIGSVYSVSATEYIQTKTGQTITRRSLVLRQRRFDQNTGEEYEPNYPQFEFSGKSCGELDTLAYGELVTVHFDIAGVVYQDKNTGEDRYFTRLRAFKVEQYIRPAQSPYVQQSTQQPQQPPVLRQPQQTQGYAPQPQPPTPQQSAPPPPTPQQAATLQQAAARQAATLQPPQGTSVYAQGQQANMMPGVDNLPF